GMILYNAKAEEDLVADVHFLPAIHVSHADGLAIKELLDGDDADDLTAEIGGGEATEGQGDKVAPFSARGPQGAVPDIPKPDVTAPGVDIIAAVTPVHLRSPETEPEPKPGDPEPEPEPGELFASLSGTSMSSPHVAGAAALLTQREPLRSPAAIKSALMTTAVPDLLEADGKTPADAFDVGSGRIDPNRAADPGLVLEVGTPDYIRYIEGLDPAIVDGDAPPLAAVDLNLPAVSFGSFTGVGATRRTFTSVDEVTGSWSARFTGLKGVSATVTPAAFDIAPGQAQAVELEFSRQEAELKRYAFGALVLEHAADGRTVRLPVTIRPVQIAAPEVAEIATDQPAGSAPVSARAGYRGELSALGWGLAAPKVLPGETVESAREPAHHQGTPGVRVFDVEVPPGSQVLAGMTSRVDGGAPDTDLDLYLFYDSKGDGFTADEEIAASADGDADEAVVLTNPPAGAYRFSVVGFKTRKPVSVFDFTTWVGTDPAPDDPAAPDGPGVAVTGDPKPVRPGETVSLDLEWSRLGGPGLYLGLVTFHDVATPDPAKPVTSTIVVVERGDVGFTPAGWTGTVGPAPASASGGGGGRAGRPPPEV
ncbi:MAG: S8 family serine peptidase, partial [Acidimicrobiia bacterium]